MPADVEEDSLPRREADADAHKRPERDLSGNKDDAMNSLNRRVCVLEGMKQGDSD